MSTVQHLREEARSAVAAICRNAGVEPTLDMEANYLAVLLRAATKRVSIGFVRCGISQADLASIIKPEKAAL